MSVHNRPWNALLVSDHLAQFGVKKAQVQRALDALCESNKLMCKEFGKAKLYLPLQPDEAGLAKEVEHMHSVHCCYPAHSCLSILHHRGKLPAPLQELDALQQSNARLQEEVKAASEEVLRKEKGARRKSV